MDGQSCVIHGELASRLAASTEDALQAPAVRPACSIAEQDLKFLEEFDGRLPIGQACTVAIDADALSAQYANDTIVTSPAASAP